MKLLWRYTVYHFRSQLEYRVSFWLTTLGQFLVPFVSFAGMALLFRQFGTLEQWTLSDVALLYGVTQLAFAFNELFIRGFDSFSSLVISGEFDRLLVRPRNMVLQVLGSKQDFTRFGRLVQSTIVFVWAIANASFQWTFLKGVCLALMVFGGMGIFAALFMGFATLSFWTIKGLEVVNLFTDGGREMAQYPLTIYPKAIQRFFTFAVPFFVVNALPLFFLTDVPGYEAAIYAFVPLIGFLALVPAYFIWNYGVRHYQSTGS
jgi:ABC-2 type transport system permease protein